MIEPPVPENEDERQAALDALGVLDTRPDPLIDRLTREAAELFDVPMAAVSLVDRDRQWFKSRVGLDATETGRDISFCGHLLASAERSLVVEDTARDVRFHDNPLVTGDLGLRFYAGSKLTDGEGRALGSLCMLDSRPRAATVDDMETLNRIADAVSGALILDHARAEVERLSGIDPYTATLNRRGLERAAARLAGQPASLLLVALSGVERMADAHGRDAEDGLLAEAAQRMGRVLRRGDQVARLGRHVFAILVLRETQAPMLRRVAERLHALLAEPFMLSATPLMLHAAIGVASAPAPDWRLGPLLEAADAALDEAQRAGAGSVRLAVEGRTRGWGRLAIADRLRVAAAAPEASFTLHYQPVFDLATGRCAAVEALLRWRVEEENVSPGLFVPLAEEMGLVSELDRFALHAAAEGARHAPRVMVNLSTHTLALPDLAALVVSAASEGGLAIGQLMVEVTETGLATRPVAVGAAIDALAEAGVPVALDDFGAGQTSLAQLHAHPLARLKIDGSLVRLAAAESKARTVLAAVARLGQALGIGVVAEGVETPGQLAMAHALGIGQVQGFLLARPCPAADLPATMATGERLLAELLSEQAAADAPPRPAASG